MAGRRKKAIAAARTFGNTINVLNNQERQLAESALEDVLAHWSEAAKKYAIDGPELIKQARQEISHYSD